MIKRVKKMKRLAVILSDEMITILQSALVADNEISSSVRGLDDVLQRVCITYTLRGINELKRG